MNAFNFLIVLTFLVGCSESDPKGYVYPNTNIDFSDSLNSNDEFQFDPNEEIPLLKDVGVKYLHDYYSSAVCHYLNKMKGKRSNEEIIAFVWKDVIIGRSAISLELPESDIVEFYQSMGINSQNYVDFGLQKNVTLPTEYLNFYNSIESAYNNAETLELFFEELNNIKFYYSNILTNDVVNSTVEVAKSSFYYWDRNINCLDGSDDEISTRVNCGHVLAFADTWGAVTGGFMGLLTGGVASLPGAMLGAEAGTLGAGISLALFGDC